MAKEVEWTHFKFIWTEDRLHSGAWAFHLFTSERPSSQPPTADWTVSALYLKSSAGRLLSCFCGSGRVVPWLPNKKIRQFRSSTWLPRPLVHLGYPRCPHQSRNGQELLLFSVTDLFFMGKGTADTATSRMCRNFSQIAAQVWDFASSILLRPALPMELPLSYNGTWIHYVPFKLWTAWTLSPGPLGFHTSWHCRKLRAEYTFSWRDGLKLLIRFSC